MEPNTFYHLYNHANGRDNLFSNDENYAYFLRKFAFYIEPIADTYAYCLMPNHFHFLIRTKEINRTFEGLKTSEVYKTSDVYSNKAPSNPYSKAMGDLCNSYTKSYNKMYNRRGNLFNHKFKRKVVEDDAYFVSLIHYIHANPVHHGFVKSMDDWIYSSYHTFLSDKKTRLKREDVLESFNGRSDFIKYHQQPIDPKINFGFEGG